MRRYYFPQLDGTWRLVQRGVPEAIDPSIDGRDCYVFQRAGEPGDKFSFLTHVVPVATFWLGPRKP